MQAPSVYTKRVFSEFKNQFRYSTGYDLTELEKNSYKISTTQYSTVPNQGLHSHIVNVDPTTQKLFCTCKFFEFSDWGRSHGDHRPGLEPLCWRLCDDFAARVVKPFEDQTARVD
ncbi:hypothetical protein ACMD2_22669 [Ananas comosus]|uniref:Uncharacterized protein n=1 Tax=Ananas comosus TaxID=4615 RepID=A0A199VWH4_ANACO|nr:hypothetical protein ACMD2_22669 [Ananas comosus]